MMNKFMTGMLMVGGLILTQTAAAAAGKFILATGAVAVVDDAGKERIVKTGGELNAGETVLTRNGRAQIRFADGGLVSLQPATEFKVDNYKFEGEKGNSESAVFKLVKGGLRAVTGLIGKERKQAYQMQTEVATIGIRGTEFQVVICAASCPEPDGLYVRTGEGVIYVKNAAGELDVSAGNTAYVASANDAPQSTSSSPAISAEASGTKPESIPGVGQSAEFRSGDILATKDLDGEFVLLDSAGLALAGSGSVTYDHAKYDGAIFAGAGSGAGAGTDTFSDGAVGVFLKDNRVTGALLAVTEGVLFVKPGPAVDARADGGLYWGRWTNTSFDVYAGLNSTIYRDTVSLDANSNLHYILGTSVPTVPGAGTATYDFIGGTASSDQSGVTGGGIASGSLMANFNSNYVDANFTVNHGGAHAVTAHMPLANNRASFSSNNLGGSASAGMHSAVVGGFFAGQSTASGPSRAGISYEIQQPGNSIVGVGAFGIQ